MDYLNNKERTVSRKNAFLLLPFLIGTASCIAAEPRNGFHGETLSQKPLDQKNPTSVKSISGENITLETVQPFQSLRGTPFEEAIEGYLSERAKQAQDSLSGDSLPVKEIVGRKGPTNIEEDLRKAETTGTLCIYGENLTLQTLQSLQGVALKEVMLSNASGQSLSMLAEHPEIEDLSIQGNDITKAGLNALVNLPNLQTLHVFQIHNLDEALPDTPLPSIKRLILNCANLKGEGLEKVARYIPDVEDLDLGFNINIPDTAFLDLQRLKSLKHLNVMGTRITYPTLKTILNELPQLKTLLVHVTSINKEEVEALRKLFPHLDI